MYLLVIFIAAILEQGHTTLGQAGLHLAALNFAARLTVTPAQSFFSYF